MRQSERNLTLTGAKLSFFEIFLRGFERDGIGQAERIEQLRSTVAHLQHQRARAALALLEAILALLVREAAGARHQRERSAHHPDQVAVGNVDRRQRQPVAAVLATLRIDDAEPAE